MVYICVLKTIFDLIIENFIRICKAHAAFSCVAINFTYLWLDNNELHANKVRMPCYV